LGQKDAERSNRARYRIDPIVTEFIPTHHRTCDRSASRRPSREILTELGINPSAGRFEGLLDAIIGEKLANALLAQKS
jgi:hypothetical protein